MNHEHETYHRELSPLNGIFWRDDLTKLFARPFEWLVFYNKESGLLAYDINLGFLTSPSLFTIVILHGHFWKESQVTPPSLPSVPDPAYFHLPCSQQKPLTSALESLLSVKNLTNSPESPWKKETWRVKACILTNCLPKIPEDPDDKNTSRCSEDQTGLDRLSQLYIHATHSLPICCHFPYMESFFLIS